MLLVNGLSFGLAGLGKLCLQPSERTQFLLDVLIWVGQSCVTTFSAQLMLIQVLLKATKD